MCGQKTDLVVMQGNLNVHRYIDDVLHDARRRRVRKNHQINALQDLQAALTQE